MCAGIIENSILQLLCDPVFKRDLRVEQTKGFNGLASESGVFYPIVDGIPAIFEQDDLGESDVEAMKFYDEMVRWFGWLECWIATFGSAIEQRKNWLKDISVSDGAKVLEVAVGTGNNIPLLNENAEYYGIDISRGMLSQCKKNLEKRARKANLIQCAAEKLPFKNEIFDIVYHVCGINFFDEKANAVRELIRVTKKGGRVIIIDEKEGHVKDFYKKIPIASKYCAKFMQTEPDYEPPFCYVPPEMGDMEVKDIDNNAMYQLSFIRE